MSHARAQSFQLTIAAAGFCGLAAELILLEHWGEPLRLAPFVAAAAGLASIALFGFHPRLWTARQLRLVMILLVVTAIAGGALHLRGNVAFELEIDSTVSFGTAFKYALGGGAPLLAPGGLALGGFVALLATYRRPALGRAEAGAAQDSVVSARPI